MTFSSVSEHQLIGPVLLFKVVWSNMNDLSSYLSGVNVVNMCLLPAKEYDSLITLN